MGERVRWGIFIAAALALFALVAALVAFAVWLVADATIRNASPPWRAIQSIFGVFFAPAWITALFALWHWRRFRRTGHRSVMVETGVALISALSVIAAFAMFTPR